MTDTTLLIKNPSVTLYAFHLCQDLSQKPEQLTKDADKLWQNCANLSELLAIPDLKFFPEKLLFQPTKKALITNYLELLPSNGRLQYQPPLQLENSPLQLEIYPLQIHDTYALDLTLYYQNITVSTSQFRQLNPQGCLLANQIQSSLGQTIVLYGEPTGKPEEDRTVADACVAAFWQETNLQCPSFVAGGQLFGSPIFEYDNNQEKPSEQGHILVWLNRHPDTSNLIQKTYYSFLNLLCCHSKILFAYHEARWCYSQTRELYAELEEDIKNFAQLPNEAEKRLRQLKQKMSQIPLKSFEYSRQLRDIGDHQTAIITNAKNYEYWLKKICESSLEGDRLEFLEDFYQQTCQRFQNQIQTDLNYLNPGEQLFEQMLRAIRGIVEIEQAESDRALERAMKEKEEAEQEREKNLQFWLTIVGTGLAVSGISAQTAAKPVETILTQFSPKQSFDCPKAGLVPCLGYSSFYVLFHVGIGVIAALVVGLLTKRFFTGKKNFGRGH